MRGIKKGPRGPHPSSIRNSAGARGDEKGHCSRFPFDARVCGFVDASSSFAPDTCTFLNNIFDYYAEFNAFHLSELTHEKGSPWDVIWQAAETGAVPGMIIPDSLILEWFRGSSARMAKTQ